MALQVIGAGLPRTGTLSMKGALEQLGFAPSYHMAEVLLPRPGCNDGHLQAWLDAYRHGTPLDWPRLFAHYRATFDAPACFHYRELMQAFPQAKLILTVRDPSAWFASWESLWASLAAARVPEKVVRLHDFSPLLDAILARHFGAVERRANIDAFLRHNDAVRRDVPAGRLLEFDVREGWGPLCRFLNCPVPEAPFPCRNDRGSMDDVLRLALSTHEPLQL
jgi:hypothetical protein